MRWSQAAACAVAVVGAFFPATTAGAGHAVSVFPSPGTRFALPGSQITFRGIPAGSIGSVSVVGSKSGAHTGRVVPDSDGDGGSFLPDHGFDGGETVTVTTTLNVAGGNQGAWRFTVARPWGPIKPMRIIGVPAGAHGVQHFRSRPDLRPASVQVLKGGAPAGQGDIFVAPEAGPVQNGPMILDTSGSLVWFHPVPRNQMATDFRVQTLGRQSVLTWWQGYVNHGDGRGEDLIYNRDYQPITAVKAGNGLQGADLHEFLLTPQGDAYILAVSPLRWPGTNKPLLDWVVQEIDVKTGLVLFEWDALDHVPLSASFFKTPRQPGYVWDPYHANSVALDRDGNVIVSMRNTWAVYKVDHSTGRVIWTLGSSRSSFKMGRGTRTVFQHDAIVHPNGELTIFDDGAGPPRKESQSRAITISLNTKRMTATLIKQDQHRPALSANFAGSQQALTGGGSFVGWGQQPYFTEFNSRGQIDFDARFVSGTENYRAYRLPWHARRPPTPPAISVGRGRHGVTTIFASWNGATNVSAYRVLGASRPNGKFSRLRVVHRHGFETALEVRNSSRYFKVQALSAKAAVLDTSAPAH